MWLLSWTRLAARNPGHSRVHVTVQHIRQLVAVPSATDRKKAWLQLSRSTDETALAAALSQLRPLQSSAEHTRVIQSFGRVQAWERAVDELDRMRRADPPLMPNVVSYSAAIHACVHSRQYRRALELLPAMRAEGVRPNAVTYTTLFAACFRAAQDSIHAALRADGRQEAQFDRQLTRHVLSMTEEMANDQVEPTLWYAYPGLRSIARATSRTPLRAPPCAHSRCRRLANLCRC